MYVGEAKECLESEGKKEGRGRNIRNIRRGKEYEQEKGGNDRDVEKISLLVVLFSFWNHSSLPSSHLSLHQVINCPETIHLSSTPT